MDSLTSAARSRLPSSRRRGFNLIEAAIVLGVVGLVIGGIWIAASAVTRNLQISRFTSGILFIVENVSRLDRTAVGMGLTNVAQPMGLIPSDWPVISSIVINTPIPRVTISGSSGIEYTAGVIYIRLNFSNNQDMCTAAMRALYTSASRKITSILGDPGFDDFNVDLTQMTMFDCATIGYFNFRVQFG